MSGTTPEIPRVTGLLIIEVRNSNPNGDPDRESDPRTRTHDKRGVISDVSFKRKLRDLVWNGSSLPAWSLSETKPPDEFLAAHEQGRTPVWTAISKAMGALAATDFQVYVCRGRTYQEPKNDEAFAQFQKRYWDCRLFGNTVIEKATDAKDESAQSQEKNNSVKTTSKGSGRYIRSGVASFGLGVSVAAVRIKRDTNTVKAAVQEGKDRGMAPLAFRVIEHGVYAMPFLINPTAAGRTGCTRDDIELMCRLVPYAYAHTASRIRPMVEVRHAWYFEHKNQLGSCSDFAVIDALTPTKRGPTEPSSSWVEYNYDGQMKLAEFKQAFAGKFKHFGDLCDPVFVDELFPRANG